jgi:hypothetical protein
LKKVLSHHETEMDIKLAAVFFVSQVPGYHQEKGGNRYPHAR